MSVIYEFSWPNVTKVSSHVLDFIGYFSSKWKAVNLKRLTVTV